MVLLLNWCYKLYFIYLSSYRGDLVCRRWEWWLGIFLLIEMVIGILIYVICLLFILDFLFYLMIDICFIYKVLNVIKYIDKLEFF